MVKQRLFLGSVAFGISFGISFLTGRGVGSAIASGVTTMAATVVAAAVVDRQQNRHAYSRIADLKHHIQALQQRRAEAYQAYMQLEAEKEHLAISLNTLAFQSGQPPFQPDQRYMMGSPVPRMLPASPRALSWNLAASQGQSRQVMRVNPGCQHTSYQPRSQPVVQSPVVQIGGDRTHKLAHRFCRTLLLPNRKLKPAWLHFRQN
jgi:hypothetical protein